MQIGADKCSAKGSMPSDKMGRGIKVVMQIVDTFIDRKGMTGCRGAYSRKYKLHGRPETYQWTSLWHLCGICVASLYDDV